MTQITQMTEGVNYKITPITPIDTSNSYYYSGRYLNSDGKKYVFDLISKFVFNINNTGRNMMSFIHGPMTFDEDEYTFEARFRSDGKSRRKSIKRKRKNRRKSIKRRSKSRRRYSK